LVSIKASGAYLSVDGQSCALLNGVDSVTIDLSAANTPYLSISLAGGPLGPGYTDEGNGSSEIEFSVTAVGPGYRLNVYGTTGSDAIRLGQYVNKLAGTVTGQLNLNSAADGATQDPDVTFTTFPVLAQLSGDAGGDVLLASGAGPTLSTPYPASAILDGTLGADQVTGGSGDDAVYFDIRSDNVGDVLAGGAGKDSVVAIGGAGVKAAITLDGVANDGWNCPGTSCAGANVAGDFETINGSSGNDLLIGDADSETIYGNGGIDIIRGLGGNDTLGNRGSSPSGLSANALFGGAGDDLLYATSGAPDSFQGGGGFDTVSFQSLLAGVVVTQDDTSNDGTPGMGADVADDIERIIGTGYGDTITGNAGPNAILGGPGPDSLFGLGGDDVLSGQGGNDDLNGGGGTDTCSQGGGTGSITGCEA
jgi:Ca2+-binding RTX toxin-like protein